MLNTVEKYQQYAEYKDSGVEWLGEIPSHWIITKVKYEAYVKARVGWHGLKSDDFTDEGPYLVTGSDFRGTNIDWSQCYHCDEPRYEQDPYIQLKNGDLLITKDGTIGKVALVNNLKNDEKATLNSGIFVVRPLRENFSTKFYFWLLQSKVFKGFVDFNKTGSTIVHLYQDTFVNFEYASPNLEDQIQITNFLDHETAKIDSLIEKQQQLIELLKEKRQAVISHAVTKGLHPDVPMKDSGVEWLGQVPEHWDIGRLKNVLSIKNGRDYKTVEVELGGYPVYGSGGIFKRSSAYLYEGVSILFGRKGTVDKPLLVDGRFWTVDTMFYSELNADTDSEYIYFQSLGFPFDMLSTNTALPSMTQEDLLNLGFVIPPHNEQKAISEYIQNYLNKSNNLVEKAEVAIQLMQERRTALISSTVTGKIDVRNWQNPNPNNNNEANTELSQ
ncbi:restriction endonuclease subunit S [Acinetobacter gerneri]|uniref:restriction endonuclease subunit S n=1 Tax=Acinetobacter gerneri TaxID=202952 RepID=UPI0028AB0C0A|nr:restriction endonuclease subunit S [Acinetobacter gerneri]